MAIIKVGKLTKNFTKISNHVITDSSLSSDAFRVFAYLSSLADMNNWKVNNKDFINKTGLSEARLAKSWKQLIAKGYVERALNREDGIFRGYNYTINNATSIDKLASKSPAIPVPKQQKASPPSASLNSTSQPVSMEAVEVFMNHDKTCVAHIAKADRAELSQKFYNYYQAIGWVINGNPIHCWQSVCVTWAINEKKRGIAKRNGTQQCKTKAENYSHVEAIIAPKETLLHQPVSASVFLPEGEDW